MHLDQRLVDAAIEFVNKRFAEQPFEGAAAMYTEDGEILISTAIEVVNESVSLCHETGAICEAVVSVSTPIGKFHSSPSS